MRDSNPRMLEPKSSALPLGESPITMIYYNLCWVRIVNEWGFDSPLASPSQHLCKTSLQELTPLRIASSNSHPECWNQNPVPYHLANPQ